MKAGRIKSLIKQYRQLLQDAGIEPADFPHDQLLGAAASTYSLSHVLAMLPKMENFIAQNQMVRVRHWLGVVQGVLWSNGLISLDEFGD